jgi:hypothetical protein
VYLITDGHDLTRIFGEKPAVELFGTDESGRDVFFRTADSLLSPDTDTQMDIYDARAEGGFPPPAAEVGCSGDPCQGPLASGLPRSSPSTLSLRGESGFTAVPGKAAKRKPAVGRAKKKAKKKRARSRVRKGKKTARGRR